MLGAPQPAPPALHLLSTLHPARHRTLAKASSRADCSTGCSQETPEVGRYSSSTSSWCGIHRASAHLLYLDHFRALLEVLCILRVPVMWAWVVLVGLALHVWVVGDRLSL